MLNNKYAKYKEFLSRFENRYWVANFERFVASVKEDGLMRVLLMAMLLSAVLPASAFAVDKVAAERQFSNWLKNEIWPAARSRGVSATTFNSALKNVSLDWKLPDLVPPGTTAKPSRPQAQAEFRSPAAYFKESYLRNLAASGRKLAAKHKTLLANIERRYGVPGRILLAIWAKETAYGAVAIPKNAFRVLATKAFMSTRKELFRAEFIAALEIVANGHAESGWMKSSWAGALGQPQFLPSSYLQYAVDFDGDGKRNIWGSAADTLASIAHYLSQKGWQPGRDWGYEAQIPPNVSCALEGPDNMRPISKWAAAGVTRISGKPFPQAELGMPAALLFPAGRSGPVFVATPNFYTIKTYNNSDLYALFVGNLADRIAYGSGPFKAAWQPVTGLKRGNVMKVQEKLIALGHDVGGADGLAGFKTRRSIGLWQEKNGLAATCFPSRELVARF